MMGTGSCACTAGCQCYDFTGAGSGAAQLFYLLGLRFSPEGTAGGSPPFPHSGANTVTFNSWPGIFATGAFEFNSFKTDGKRRVAGNVLSTETKLRVRFDNYNPAGSPPSITNEIDFDSVGASDACAIFECNGSGFTLIDSVGNAADLNVPAGSADTPWSSAVIQGFNMRNSDTGGYENQFLCSPNTFYEYIKAEFSTSRDITLDCAGLTGGESAFNGTQTFTHGSTTTGTFTVIDAWTGSGVASPLTIRIVQVGGEVKHVAINVNVSGPGSGYSNLEYSPLHNHFYRTAFNATRPGTYSNLLFV